MATNNVIKSPKGAAAEYAKHSFSAYKRCTNGCSYCYLNRGVLSKNLGSGVPELRSCFSSEEDVVIKFEQELKSHKERLIADGGIFFSFITDPCLPETISLTLQCAVKAMEHDVPVTILTKMADWVSHSYAQSVMEMGASKNLLCIGFTLTGHDDMEPNADCNEARIRAMKLAHSRGVKTFASIEPIIDFGSSLEMIEKTIYFCDLYRIGLRSGVKADYYDKDELAYFIGQVECLINMKNHDARVYWKHSVRERITFTDSDYWTSRYAVDADYNIFTSKI